MRPIDVEWGEGTHVYAATTHWRKADSCYQDAVSESLKRGGSHVVQLAPWLTSADPRDLVGGLITGQIPVAREFRPRSA